MAQCLESVQNKICTNTNNTELMNQIFVRCIDIVGIWEKIGFDQDIINNRIEMLQKTLLNTLEEINEGEIDLYNQIKDSINRYKQKVDDLKLRLKVDITPLIAKIASTNNSSLNNAKEHDCSLGIDQSLIISNQTKLLEENYFYKNLFNELESIKEERQKKCLDLKKREQSLIEHLDESYYSVANKSVLDESDLIKYENHVNNLNNEKEKRFSLLKKFNENILKISEENHLEIDIKSSLYQFKFIDEESFQNYEIDSSSMEKYRKSMDRLITKRDELIDNIDTIRHDINYMWDRFKIRNEALAHLVDGLKIEYNQQVFKFLLAEYERCVELKKLKLKDAIYDLRDQIKSIWLNLVLAEDEIVKFESFLNETNISEELLIKHEIYLNELKEYSVKYETLFSSIQKWVQKWHDHVKFENEYSDPNRFSKRNYSSLREERQRNHFSNELPKLEKQVENEANNYYVNENSHFKYAGQPILLYIKQQKEKYDLNREASRRTKKNSEIKTPLSTSKKPIVNNRATIFKTPISVKTDKKDVKTPRSSTVSVTKKIQKNQNVPNSKKRISFAKPQNLKRRSKSCSDKNSKAADFESKENFDTILCGYYKYKGKNNNVSSGIESIVSLSDLENPACNSSFIF